MRAAVNTYRGELEPILTTIGQARAPSGFDAFTEFGTAVAGLEAETPQASADSRALEQAAADTLASGKAALPERADAQSARRTARVRSNMVPPEGLEPPHPCG